MPNLARNVPPMAALDPHAVAIGAAVRGAIAQAGLTQAEAAAKIGLSLNTFSRRINGALPFTWPELVRVADAAGVKVSDLATTAERIAARGTAA